MCLGRSRFEFPGAHMCPGRSRFEFPGAHMCLGRSRFEFPGSLVVSTKQSALPQHNVLILYDVCPVL
jgi:hypothetical protein